MQLKDAPHNSIILLGKDRVFAVGDTAWKVATQKLGIPGLRLIPLTYANGEWVRDTSKNPMNSLDVTSTRECTVLGE